MPALTLVYDDQCRLCISSKNLLQWLSFSSQVRWYPLSQAAALPFASAEMLGRAPHEMALWIGKWHFGWSALTQLSARLPQFWLFFPLMFLLQVTTIGPRLYRWLARNRYLWLGRCGNGHCEVD